MKVVSLQLALCAKEHLPEHARKPGQLHLDRITRTDQVRDPAVFAACSGAGKGSRHVPSAATEAKFVSVLCCVFPRVRRRCERYDITLSFTLLTYLYLWLLIRHHEMSGERDKSITKSSCVTFRALEDTWP